MALLAPNLDYKNGDFNKDHLHPESAFKDYLPWSLLGLLMREGKMKRVEKKKHKAVVR